jgi:hypothetical protein
MILISKPITIKWGNFSEIHGRRECLFKPALFERNNDKKGA